MAIDWGGLISGGIDLLQGQQVGGYQTLPALSYAPMGSPVATAPSIPSGAGPIVSTQANCGTGCNAPRYLTYDCKTGTFSPKRRRRRGRLLTSSDQHDLGVIVAMFGKGAAAQIALAAAVKR